MRDFVASTLEDAASVIRPTFDVYKELETLHEELRRISTLREMAATQGWQDFKKWIIGLVADYDQQIIRLADDPIKNSAEIKSRKTIRESHLQIVNAIDKTLETYPDKMAKMQELTEITQHTSPG